MWPHDQRSWVYWKFFYVLSLTIKNLYRTILELEITFLQHLKINLFEIEPHISILDFQFYTETLLERIEKANKEKKKQETEYLRKYANRHH